MTQEEKQLLLKDLCARLPYKVIVHLDYMDGTTVTREMGIGSLHDIIFDNAKGKPYLHPMSSMIADEVLEYISLKESIAAIDDITYFFETYKSIDWLNAHHFDYRGLIEKGLAIKVTEENNPYKD